jgi:ribosomal protein S18 acetylase RimI-like enzyme
MSNATAQITAAETGSIRSWQLRPAKQADAPAIAALTAELGYSAADNQTSDWLALLLASNSHSVLVAQEEQGTQEPRQETPPRLLGWMVVEARLSLETGLKAEITGLVVTHRCRRLGVGRGLVSAASQWARERGLDRLQVKSNISRDAAHHFYQRQGFVLKKTAHCYEMPLPVSD